MKISNIIGYESKNVKVKGKYVIISISYYVVYKTREPIRLRTTKLVNFDFIKGSVCYKHENHWLHRKTLESLFNILHREEIKEMSMDIRGMIKESKVSIKIAEDSLKMIDNMNKEMESQNKRMKEILEK